jgi:hypothetical protein
MSRSRGNTINHAIAVTFPTVTPKIAAGNAKKNGVRKMPTIHPAAPRADSAAPMNGKPNISKKMKLPGLKPLDCAFFSGS